MLELKKEFETDYKGGEWEAHHCEEEALLSKIVGMLLESGLRLNYALNVLEDAERSLRMAAGQIPVREIAGMLDRKDCPHSEEQGQRE